MKRQIISNKFLFEIEQRIKGELEAESMYRQLSSSMQNLGFLGASNYFLKEAENEVTHFKKLVDFCQALGGNPEISFNVQNIVVNSLQEAFEVSFNAELNLLEEYSKLSRLAGFEEPSVLELSQWFVKEQVSAVGEYNDLLAKLEITKEPLLIDNSLWD